MSDVLTINNSVKKEMIDSRSLSVSVKSNGRIATYSTSRGSDEEPEIFQIAVISQKRAYRLAKLRKAILDKALI